MNLSFPFPGFRRKKVQTRIVLDVSIVHLWAALAYFVTPTPVELKDISIKIFYNDHTFLTDLVKEDKENNIAIPIIQIQWFWPIS